MFDTCCLLSGRFSFFIKGMRQLFFHYRFPVQVLLKNNFQGQQDYQKYAITPTLSAWSMRGQPAFRSILKQTLFLNQLHELSLLSLNSLLQQFFKSKFIKKIP